MLAQYWKKQKLFVPVIFVLCLVIEYLPLPMASLIKFPLAILLSLVLGYVFYQHEKKKAA